MSDPKELAQQFLAALSANDTARYEAVLSDDAALRLGRWDGSELYRPRWRVIQRLMDEWSAWPDPRLETLTIMSDADKAAIEFRLQATENHRYVEHTRSAFLTIKDDKISIIDLYCNEPVPSARRKGWIAPATLTEDELHQVFESMMNSGDPREWLAPDESERFSLRGEMGGNGQPHPSGNYIGGVRWTDEEVDRRIAEMIAYHRERNLGFQWWVSPYDTPRDLRERLERQGMVLAGDAATMARLGLDHLDDISRNPDVTIELLDGYDDAALDALGHIMMVCFHWPQEKVEERRPGWVDRMRDLKIRERETNYLARLKGQPVGYGRVQLRAGVAYLGGAATLPEFRGRHIYSTLVRLRLEVARSKGYQLAVINAEPLSRPIAARCGFKEYARAYIYGWMPVIDLDVIKSLVPQ
jgi:ketosteroid isomerase-like protein/predicted N-acetyltransferase YhbS